MDSTCPYSTHQAAPVPGIMSVQKLNNVTALDTVVDINEGLIGHHKAGLSF